MLLRSRGRVFAIGILLITTAFLSIHLSFGSSEISAPLIESIKGKPNAVCPDRLDWLSELDLVYPIAYARREIIVNPRVELERAPLTRISERLFPNVQRIDFADNATIDRKRCKKPLVLDVPALPKESEDASHIMFGISTTLERLEASIPQLIRWLPNTNAQLFVIVVESEAQGNTTVIAADPLKKQELQGHMRNLHMNVTLIEPFKLGDSLSEKYLSLLKIMHDNQDKNTQWISTIDDDTFFPSMPALLSTLKQYNPQEKYYIGGVSEGWGAVAHYGMKGYGGAGIFISIALASVIAGGYQHCQETIESSAGDFKIMRCIYELTDVKLTNQRDFHQIDIHGDLSGLFESGRMPLSLHNWKPGAATHDGFDLPMMHQVSDICQDCFLQRWRFNNDVILSNGYSIARYPDKALKEAKMHRMEQTWSDVRSVGESNNHGVDHSLGPTRPKLILDEQKIQYRLIYSANVDGGVRQAYYHRGLDGDADSVFELFWTKADQEESTSLHH